VNTLGLNLVVKFITLCYSVRLVEGFYVLAFHCIGISTSSTWLWNIL